MRARGGAYKGYTGCAVALRLRAVDAGPGVISSVDRRPWHAHVGACRSTWLYVGVRGLGVCVCMRYTYVGAHRCIAVAYRCACVCVCVCSRATAQDAVHQGMIWYDGTARVHV